MKKLIIYSTGQYAVIDGDAISITTVGAKITHEIDVTHAIDQEIEQLRKDPHNQTLIAQIKKRV